MAVVDRHRPALAKLARQHLGADEGSDVALFNRTSGGVIAAVAALVPAGGLVASLVPRGRAHPCVRRGARLVGATIVEGPSLDVLTENDPDPMQRLFYAASVLHCLPVGRSEANSAATGTVLRTSTLEAYAGRAGFADRPRRCREQEYQTLQVMDWMDS